MQDHINLSGKNGGASPVLPWANLAAVLPHDLPKGVFMHVNIVIPLILFGKDTDCWALALTLNLCCVLFFSIRSSWGIFSLWPPCERGSTFTNPCKEMNYPGGYTCGNVRKKPTTVRDGCGHPVRPTIVDTRSIRAGHAPSSA